MAFEALFMYTLEISVFDWALAIKNEDIRNVSIQLKNKKFANIYSGRKLSLIIKKLEDGSNTIVNLVYPVNNTTSIRISKYKDNFKVEENILQLYK